MDSRLIKPKALMKPLLLKDYLLDDVSSCSSNGFKSFPRRQCCTSTIRFLLEIELKQQQQKYSNINKTLPPSLLKPPSKSALAAFKTVVAAVKRLPCRAPATSPENTRIKNSLWNLSNKILKKTRFWKRKSNRKEIQRWKSFDELLKEESELSEISGGSMRTEAFTAPGKCSSGNSCSGRNLNSPMVEASKNGVVSADSSASSTGSSSKEEKQQLSPVSVLDCPFDDDDEEEVSSPFPHSVTNFEGTDKKHTKKTHKLEPVDLSKKFLLLEKSDNIESSGSTSPADLKPTSDIKDKRGEEQQNRTEERAQYLLNQMKDTMPSYGIKVKAADKLLLHFFQERIIANNAHSHYSLEENLLEEAENWINGRRSGEGFIDQWEAQANREAYIRDMEKGGEWKLLDQENNEVSLELEGEVFGALLSELLVDILS